MTDIVVYTNPKMLAHKKGANGFQRYYWEFSRFPKDIWAGDRIFFAVKGFVQGSFEIDQLVLDDNQIEWDKDSWIELEEKISTKPFRGFRYKWW